jgi:hypothetical protein
MIAHVDELIASQQCTGKDRKVVWIGDGGQCGTNICWDHALGQWCFVDVENPSRPVKRADEIALVHLDGDADSEKLNTLKLACDLEREDGLWVVDGSELGSLTTEYGTAIRVVWLSGGPLVVPKAS